MKDQGSCGGCYAFSTAAAMEGAYKIKTGELVDFSIQQYIDCTRKQGNNGCNGGFMTNSFKYLQSNKAMLASDYPYTGKAATC